MNHAPPKRVGVVLSAGGSSFEAGFQASGCARSAVHVVTDRECDAERRAAALGLSHSRIVERDAEALSSAMADEFRKEGCDAVLLNFSRLVTASLFDALPTFNVHPSLLPAFPGLDGVGDAHKAGTLFQGATLHRVDASVDDGPIVAQSVLPVPRATDEARRRHLGYLQTALMVISFFDLIAAGRLDPATGQFETTDLPPEGVQNPGLIDPDRQAAARALLAASGIET